MKKSLLALLIIGLVFISGCVTEDGAGNGANGNSGGENNCADYDGNQAECLLHEECEWSADDSECNTIDMDEDDDGGLNQELENINIPDSPSNTLCKQIPLSNEPPYSERYYCLAVVNHNAEFCEGIDEANEKNICLAHVNENSSYCKKVEGQDSKHVCYYMLAVTSENADFCSDIDYSQHEKEQCYFNFMSNLYQWNKSDEIKTDYCNEFPADYEDRDTCFALKERDISLCNNVANCLTFFEQDLSFCDEHPEIDCCMRDRAKTGKNVSICELLPQPERDICIGGYCTHTELDVTICDTIIGLEERQDRYIELAINLANE